MKLKEFNIYHNPLYCWWKARKYFKRPKCHLIIRKNLWFFGLPINTEYYKPIIDITCSSPGWNYRYNEVIYEWDPYIQICLFRTLHIVWIFNWVSKKDSDSLSRSRATWEALLNYLYNDKTIEECINRLGEDDIHKNLKSIVL